MSQRHQEVMAAKRTAWTVISDGYILARREGGTYFGAYGDALLFAMTALKQRRLGKRLRIPKISWTPRVR